LLALPTFALTAELITQDNSANDDSAYLATDSSSAVTALLTEAKSYFEDGQHEQAAAKLERALRIDPRNPILWHNLAGVRLQQEDWERAASLAAKANALAVDNKWLRARNWIVIALACEGMKDNNCALEARKRARVLANN
jgi:Tfp pilus assembly protein PilF